MPRSDSPLRDRLVFVVGARRSGTNWLQRILTAHPGVAGLPSETYVFNMGVQPLTERFQHANPGSTMMATMFAERDTFVDGVRDLLDRAFLDNLNRLDPNARYLVERTPWHVYDLQLIAEVYPDARAIHIIRDGRAVTRSLMAQNWGPNTMEEAAEEWRSSVESGRRGGAVFGSRYTEVFYERLLDDPGPGVDELCAWLGLEFDPETRDRILLEAASQFNVDPGSPGVSADKWREALSVRDLAKFDDVAGALLEDLGYERDTGGRQVSRREVAEAHRRSALAAAGRLRHPRTEIRKKLAPKRARQKRATLARNFAVVDRFQKAVERGNADEALSLFGPQARVRISHGEESKEGRGTEAGTALLEALAEHQLLDPRQLWGKVHSSPNAFTVVSVYELPDGQRWSRILVLTVTDAGVISAATLYRFRADADRKSR